MVIGRNIVNRLEEIFSGWHVVNPFKRTKLCLSPTKMFNNQQGPPNNNFQSNGGVPNGNQGLVPIVPYLLYQNQIPQQSQQIPVQNGMNVLFQQQPNIQQPYPLPQQMGFIEFVNLYRMYNNLVENGAVPQIPFMQYPQNLQFTPPNHQINPQNAPTNAKKRQRENAKETGKTKEKKIRLIQEDTLTIQTEELVSAFVQGHVIGVELLLVKKDSRTESGMQFFGNSAAHNTNKLYLLLVDPTKYKSLEVFVIQNMYFDAEQNRTYFEMQFNLPAYSGGLKPIYGAWKDRYIGYKLAFIGQEGGFMSQLIRVNKAVSKTEGYVEVAITDATALIPPISLTAVEISPNSGKATQPYYIVHTSEHVVRPSVFWRHEWNVSFGDAQADVTIVERKLTLFGRLTI
jgi:hypothetical protein